MTIKEALADETKTILNIDGVDCLVSTYWNIHNSTTLEEQYASSGDYCLAIATVIHHNILNEVPLHISIERICNNEQVLEDYAKAVISENEWVEKYYEDNRNESVCYNFVLANKTEIAEAFKETKASKEEILKLRFAGKQAEHEFHAMATRIGEIFNEASHSLSDTIDGLCEELQLFITDSEKAIRFNCKEWGKYGWTVMPFSSQGYLSTFPSNPKHANQIALKYCTPKYLDVLFAEMLQMKLVKKDMFKQAVDCFKKRHYDACCLLLFAIVDGKLIRAQEKPRPKSKKESNNKRPHGKVAYEAVFNKLKGPVGEKIALHTLIEYENLLACLGVVFKNGKDFKRVKQKANLAPVPTPINRNYASHGMMHRRIKRKDCIQLFLVYYNLLEFLNVYYDAMKGAHNNAE